MSEIDSVAEAPRTSVRKPPPTERDWVLGEAAASAGSGGRQAVGTEAAAMACSRKNAKPAAGREAPYAPIMLS